jgi:hypothetical protein
MFSIKTLRNLEIKIPNNNQIKKNFSQIINNKLNKLSSINNANLHLAENKNKIISNQNKFNFSTKFNNKDDILPDHLFYDIPKYSKNPENVDFPWLIGGAPFLELKVYCKNKF